MIHLDLFSGIGGFAYAADQVFDNVEHIFCDNDEFCRQVLKKHWPESEIYDDIRSIAPNSNISRYLYGKSEKQPTKRRQQTQRKSEPSLEPPFLLTGGFPCQPFSAAGLRRGTADERHLWPEMLRVIRLTQPEWVIAENVRGIITWNEGLVFEQVCLDLETSGYEVQPFIIPAVAVNAPHRRDRVWIIGHNTNADNSGLEGSKKARDTSEGGQDGEQRPRKQGIYPDWNRSWQEVALATCNDSVDDGLPVELDGFKLSKSQHRKEQLKAYGNAIVPAVAVELMKSIQLAGNQYND